MNAITSIIAIPLGYIMKGCYWLADTALHLPLSYVFTLLFFTIATKLLMFPLSYKQHVASAKMAAFGPMIKEIQTKYAKDKQRQSEELNRLTVEYGYSPTAGCLPLILSFVIMFGLVEVIYKPLTYMLTLPKDVVTLLTERTISLAAQNGVTLAASNRMIETSIIQYVKTNFAGFADIAAQHGDILARIQNLDMSIGSINLYEKPEMKLSLAIIIPLFSIATQLLSTLISMKNSTVQGDEMTEKQNRMMLWSTSIMFAWFSFLYPLGFSLYWGFQNLLTLLQNVLLRAIRSPEKIQQELQDLIKQKKKEKKARRTVTVTDKNTGKQVEKEVSADEANRIRLQRAREIDRERYGE